MDNYIRLIIARRLNGETELFYCPYSHMIAEGDLVYDNSGDSAHVVAVECCEKGGNIWSLFRKAFDKMPTPVWKWSEIHVIGGDEYEQK